MRQPVFLFCIALGDWRPGFVWIESFHFCEFAESVSAKILFVNNTVIADHEGLHSGFTVLGRRRESAKPPIITPLTT